ncbi:DUF2917 domain-containing protein [Cupriavidus sp. AU9028]|uniref:DUF2917 domain-containing protein n=1 Tax=Cupriavidus sp. AU9028 TaxID=2871157 RepID=UPI001C94FF09|nr:DUF2917 domain-containing protein [Cupriavidus sp. AU9028]MBY4896610.1 DUF2917 domain-containing protein [Cupriavidus sp. AU9028]
MQELRDFELDGSGRPVQWRAGSGERVTARTGRLWLTVEGEAADIWLLPGQTAALPTGGTVWISGEERGSRFTLARPANGLSSSWRGAMRRLLAPWGKPAPATLAG